MAMIYNQSLVVLCLLLYFALENRLLSSVVNSASLSSGSQDRAVLLYEYIGKKLVDLQHTEVPDAYRGRGIAKHLAKVKVFLFFQSVVPLANIILTYYATEICRHFTWNTF